jgi:hypothetical protein
MDGALKAALQIRKRPENVGKLVMAAQLHLKERSYAALPRLALLEAFRGI